ncbi:b(0,+)-type amino acid transporter 1-like [Asterias rubens]|uniref:b(0,+)-type amino acid transporter 1-like n=1 Tax=Asterias rubens TaxID=7604 RepID=UPI0014557B58|nr:b(0,+)-type amino acid transporter 1-like [Asterias rubens]XP_033636078.1 b(0,+)-type amino acid transporter 1-like [Asterias rubens]
MASEGPLKLKRELGLVRGVALIVGAMIGSGIFISPKGVLIGAESVGMSLVLWVVCAVITSLGALCFAELGTLVPKSGGNYTYVLMAFGDLAGFMVVWAFAVIIKPCGIALSTLTLSTYVIDYIIPGDCAPPMAAVQLFAIVTIMLIVFINCMSVKIASGLPIFFSSGKVMALVIIIVAGLVQLCKGLGATSLNPSVAFEGTSTDIGSYSFALYNGLWAYAGWEILNTVTEEAKNPQRNIPLAICIAVPSVTVIYLLTNIAYFAVLSPTELLASSAVAVTVAERTLGPMAWLIPLGVCISTSGNCIGSLLANPRITFAAGREGHMIKVMSMVTVKRLTPLPAIVLQGTIGIILISFGDFDSIIRYSGFVKNIFQAATFVALMVLRWKLPDQPRAFKVNILVPILATMSALFLVLVPLIFQPTLEYLYAIVLLVLGLIVYFVFVRGKRQLPFMDGFTLICQKLFLVSPSVYTADETD